LSNICISDLVEPADGAGKQAGVAVGDGLVSLSV